MYKRRYSIESCCSTGFASNYEDAELFAKRMIDSIARRGLSDESWWAKIHDNHKGVTQLIWRRGNYLYMKTQWLLLR